MTQRLNKAALFEDLGYKPHEGQQPVHASTAPRRVLACGVRWGKSLCAAMEAIAAAMEPRKRSMGWVVAPTYDLSEKVFREIVVLVAEHLRHRIVSMREREKVIVLRNMAGGLSEVRGKSADNPVSLLGEGLDFLIVDEAAQLRAAIWESYLSQRLIDKKGNALFISTPKGKGWFYDAYRQGQDPDSPGWASWNAPSWQNPTLSRELIEEQRLRLPDRVFAQEYGAEFVEGSGAVFRNIRESATGEWRDPVPGMTYYAGLDLAKTVDYTVLVILDRERRVVFVDRFHKLDWAIQRQRIKAALQRFGHARVLVDSTGAGEPIYEELMRDGCLVEPYGFTQRSKSDLINNLALMLEKSEITLPRYELWPQGIEELEAFQYSVTDSGNVKSGAPSGWHDDTVIALSLAAWMARNRGEPSFCIVSSKSPGSYLRGQARRARMWNLANLRPS